MKSWTESAFTAAVACRIEARDGPAAAALLLEDPLDRYATMFNSAMSDVAAEYIERAYAGPLAVVAGMVAAGRIAGPAQLFAAMSSVLLMTALHFRVRSHRRENPQVPRRRRRTPGDDAADRLPLFVRGSTDPDRAVGGVSPADNPIERSERFRLLLSEARGIGRLGLRTLREVRRYEEGRGTQYGAFAAVARLCTLDGRGRVRGIGRPRPGDGGQAGLALPSVVRQVRRLYEAAAGTARRRAFLLGYRPGRPE